MEMMCCIGYVSSCTSRLSRDKGLVLDAIKGKGSTPRTLTECNALFSKADLFHFRRTRKYFYLVLPATSPNALAATAIFVRAEDVLDFVSSMLERKTKSRTRGGKFYLSILSCRQRTCAERNQGKMHNTPNLIECISLAGVNRSI